MAAQRSRFARRLLIAVASVVLLVVAYAASNVSLVFASNAELVPHSVRQSRAFFWYIFPACWYAEFSGWPGSSAYKSCMQWSMQAGQRIRDQG